MRIKGLRDIKTHGILAREGRLIGVARDLRRTGNRESGSRAISDDWSVERHIYPKKKPVRSRQASATSLHRELFLENQVRLYQIEVARDFLQEMRQAMAEGIPVAMREFERLTKKLVELNDG